MNKKIPKIRLKGDWEMGGVADTIVEIEMSGHLAVDCDLQYRLLSEKMKNTNYSSSARFRGLLQDDISELKDLANIQCKRYENKIKRWEKKLESLGGRVTSEEVEEDIKGFDVAPGTA
jgi:hypothetical protein